MRGYPDVCHVFKKHLFLCLHHFYSLMRLLEQVGMVSFLFHLKQDLLSAWIFVQRTLLPRHNVLPLMLGLVGIFLVLTCLAWFLKLLNLAGLWVERISNDCGAYMSLFLDVWEVQTVIFLWDLFVNMSFFFLINWVVDGSVNACCQVIELYSLLFIFHR